jgi:hypothetical protein
LWAVLAACAVLVASLGLALPESGSDEFQRHLAWAIFACVALVVQLAPTVAPLLKLATDRAWTIGAVGVGGLVIYWLLLVLPSIESNHGFALTIGTAAAALGLWLTPGRPIGALARPAAPLAPGHPGGPFPNPPTTGPHHPSPQPGPAQPGPAQPGPAQPGPASPASARPPDSGPVGPEPAAAGASVAPVSSRVAAALSRPSARVLLAAVALGSLMLGWGSSADLQNTGTRIVPGSLYYDSYDGWQVSPMQILPGFTFYNPEYFSGTAAPARALVPAAVALVWLGLRRSRFGLAWGGIALAVLAGFMRSPGVTSIGGAGRFLCLAAAIMGAFVVYQAQRNAYWVSQSANLSPVSRS